MGRKLAVPSKLLGTKLQIRAIKKIATRHTTPLQISKRAKILLLGFACKPHSVASKELDVSINTIKSWRKRWGEAYEELSEIETEVDLTKALHLFFKDLPRPGKPNKFTQAQRKQIVALACDQPTDHGIEMTEWTNEMLALTSQAKGIVDSISKSQVRRILKNGAVTTT